MVKYLICALFLVFMPLNGQARTEQLGKRCSSILSLVKGQESLLEDIIAESYKSSPHSFETILSFIRDCPKEYQTAGYGSLLKSMQKNNRVWSNEGLKLAFAISRSDADSALASEFPQTIQQLYFNNTSPNCLLKNMEFHEYYYAADSYYGYDKRRRNNFCWTAGASSTKSVYDVRVVADDVFTLRNTYYNEYLYAEEAEFSHSTERRRVFSFRKTPTRPVGSEWKFEPLTEENVFQIRNTRFNEVLYADGDVMYDSSRREVFTERLNGHAVDKWSHWSLEC